MTVRVRPAGDGDRPAIWAVHVRAIRETCSRSYSPEQIATWAGLLSPGSYKSVLQKQVVVVAAEGATVVGFGQLDPDAGEVEAVYVRPDRQGEGIGRVLLSELEERARGRGIGRLELSATLNAADFYERAGYARGRATAHRLPAGVEIPCVRMAKDLRAEDVTSLDGFLGSEEPHATFQDARLVAVNLDYRNDEAVTTWEICVGDPDDSMRAVRERRRTGRLIFSGMTFWVMDPPQALDARPGLPGLTRSGHLSDAPTEAGRGLARRLPADASGWYFFFAGPKTHVYCGARRITCEWA